MVRLEKVSKSFKAPDGGEVVALDAVDLEIATGDFVVVVGPSGSGKSTLLYSVGGLAAPSGGTVYVGDRDVYSLGANARAALRRQEVGYVFQTFNLVPYLGCLENVALPALLAGKDRRLARARAVALLERFGLGARRSHRPGQLSVGERQRVGIARAIANGPSLLLADEPTGNLDRDSGDHVMRALAELNADGLTVVMVTHDLRLAGQARRRIRLEAGRIAADERLAC